MSRASRPAPIYGAAILHVHRAQQRGYALLLLLLVIVLSSTAFLLPPATGVELQRIHAARDAANDVSVAIDALVVYNLDDDRLPGSLPCPDDHSPDDPDSGKSPLLSGDDCPAYVGRLPWKTIDSPHSTRNLWYILDPDFRDSGIFRSSGEAPLNNDLDGSLTLDERSGFAALVVDPGPVLEGQERPDHSVGEVDDFLDGEENIDGDDQFVNCGPDMPCNDRIFGITVTEVFEPVRRRVLKVVDQELRAFAQHQGFLPYAADFGEEDCGRADSITVGSLALQEGDCGADGALDSADFDGDDIWVVENEWLGNVIYIVDLECTEAGDGCMSPGIHVNEESGFASVLAAPGKPMPTQSRPGDLIAGYLDEARNTDGDNDFHDHALSDEDNDVLRGVRFP